MSRMPALFIGHGSPMNTLELNGYTRRGAPRRAACRGRARCWSISAHWFFGATAVTAMPRRGPSTISTASRPSCSRSTIPRPGDPELAAE